LNFFIDYPPINKKFLQFAGSPASILTKLAAFEFQGPALKPDLP